MKYATVIEEASNNYAAHALDPPSCVATAKSRPRVIQLMRE